MATPRTKLKDRILPSYTKGEEAANMITHIIGGAFGIAYLVLCVIIAALHHSPMGVVTSSIYGASVITVFTMSAVYHGVRPEMAKKVLQVIDHCMIYFMIAGTYTPITLCLLRKNNTAIGWVIFGVVWAITALAVTLTAIDLKKYKIFSMICYIALGWCIIFYLPQTLRALTWGGSIFLITGGVMYTIGAVLYGVGKKKRYMHAVFHTFVVLASVLHFFCIAFYVL
ncbi:MAG: hemolysin III family protein [Ruminococcaceae bacterium]|nr:hemolysin III family protein [Oscillospiraceae bacterium]